MSQTAKRQRRRRLQWERGIQRVRRTQEKHIVEELEAIARHRAALPELDSRSPEELLCDGRGLPV